MSQRVLMFLGLGKTLFNSSAALIENSGGHPEVTLALSERLLRHKASGAWPEKALDALSAQTSLMDCLIAENRDVISPALKEAALNQGFPFFDYLKAKGLEKFSSHFNPDVQFITHHLCHATAAALMSPFEKALVVVLDGAGSRAEDFPALSAEISDLGPKSIREQSQSSPHEELSVYLLNRKNQRPSLDCVEKRWETFVSSSSSPSSSVRHFSNGVGIFYETIAEYIFNSGRAAGKVMGLAPLGRAQDLPDSKIDFAEQLNWDHAFQSKGRQAWETSPSLDLYADLAATTQSVFEKEVHEILLDLRKKYPDYDNVILTGGCALNCSFNGKLVRSGLYNQVYIPPFPGDESIGLGAAAHLYFQNLETGWTPLSHEYQQAYFGPKSSEPTEEKVRQTFGSDFHLVRPESLTEFTAEILAQGHVVAWFQGRSESGPRALGHRSLLARPDQSGLKDFLNSRIKFRESFRPYGASCSYEKAHEYFEVPMGFHTPYMAFAMPTKKEMKERLSQVTHVDGTCRFQSVRPGQDSRFYELLQAFGKKTDLFCLLNTSLNVMGEPIVESVEDAKNFLLKMNEQETSPVHGMAVGDFYIYAKGSC